MAGGILKTPARAEINAVQIAEQQVALAETSFQLQRHQQFPPLALQGFPLAHLLWVEAAGQLLGEGAAALQYPAPHQVGEQGAAGAHRIHAWMPPEAAVFTGEQRIDQHRRVVA